MHENRIYSISEAKKAALRQYPEFAWTLIPAIESGWKFVPPAARGFDDLRGFRLWNDDWADAVRIRSDRDVYGLRIDPDAMRVWYREGTLTEVMRGLLELPPPHDPRAPRLVIGHAPRPIPRVAQWPRAPWR